MVTRAGGRLWRFRYRVGGVEKLLTLGAYPDVSLKRARERREDARREVADGVDPSAKRKAEKSASENTFVAVTDEWLLTKKNSSARVRGSATATSSTNGWFRIWETDRLLPSKHPNCWRF